MAGHGARRRAVPPASRRALLGAAAVWGVGAFAACSGVVRPGDSLADTPADTPALTQASTAASAPEPTPAPTLAQEPTEEPTARFDAAAHSTTDATSPWVVVNKQHPLAPLDYEPAPTATVTGEVVAAVAAPDLEALLAHSRDDGVALTLVSGFRSFAYQDDVHRRSVARNGQAGADRYSARAGHSEHQTGLAVDFSSADGRATLSPSFAGTDEGLWLAAHAAGHGWLLRYTEADQPVTGYSPEPWHFRWVGVELCAAMAARGVATLEEFFGVTGGPDYPA